MASVAYSFQNVFSVPAKAEQDVRANQQHSNGLSQSEADVRGGSYVNLAEQLKAPQGNGEGRNEFEGIVGSRDVLHLVLEAGRACRSKVRRTHVETDLENSKARHGHSAALLQNSDSRESRNSRNSRDSRELGRDLSPSSFIFINLEMAAALLPIAVSAWRPNGPGKE